LDGIEKNGGIVQIAQDLGLTTDQVKVIVKELYILKSVWNEAQA